jgi:hypothetical protein
MHHIVLGFEDIFQSIALFAKSSQRASHTAFHSIISPITFSCLQDQQCSTNSIIYDSTAGWNLMARCGAGFIAGSTAGRGNSFVWRDSHRVP